MLTDPQKRNAAYLAIVWVLVMEAFSLLPPGPFACVVNPENYPEYYAQYKECPPFHFLLIDVAFRMLDVLGDHEWMLVIFTGILALFTIRLWYSTDKLWRITRSTLDHAEQATRKELRSYISVRPHGINRTASITNSKMFGSVGFVNVGKIPARNVSWSLVIETGAKTRADFPQRKVETTKRAIQPGAEMRAGTVEIGTNSDSANDYLFVWGRVEYDDEFGTGRFTNFCHRYPRAVLDRDGNIKIEFSRHHPYGNEIEKSEEN